MVLKKRVDSMKKRVDSMKKKVVLKAKVVAATIGTRCRRALDRPDSRCMLMTR